MGSLSVMGVYTLVHKRYEESTPPWSGDMYIFEVGVCIDIE